MPRAAHGLPLLLPLDRASRQPLHMQIAAGLRAAIARSELSAGQELPSSRQLCADLGVSRIPVLTAYAQLVAEGYFETRAAAATFVARALPDVPRGASESAPPHPRPRRLRLARRVAALPRYVRQPWVGMGPFGLHQPALDQFPYPLWARLVQRASAQPPSPTGPLRMQPLGLERVRAAIAAYLRTARAVRCEPGQIMLVSGSQQALDLCARVLCEPGSKVWMEEPGYWLAREAFLSSGCSLVPVPVDADGMVVAAGIRRAPRARMAFVSPAHQFPLGATLSAPRRLQLLQWARKADAWILEDDYDGEFRFDAQPIASLQSLDRDARVIYIGTFSKVLFPSLRLGYLVLPPDLVDAFIAVRRTMDVCPPFLIQEAIAGFILEGHFARHIQRMRRLYRERRAALVASLARHLPAWTLHGAESGLHLAITPPQPLDDVKAAARGAAAGLRFWPLSPCFWRPPRRSGFLLGFGSTPAPEIPAAVELLRCLAANC